MSFSCLELALAQIRAENYKIAAPKDPIKFKPNNESTKNISFKFAKKCFSPFQMQCNGSLDWRFSFVIRQFLTVVKLQIVQGKTQTFLY